MESKKKEKKEFLNKKTSNNITTLENFVIKKSKGEKIETNITKEITIEQLSDIETLSNNRLTREFYTIDCVDLAKNLLGKIIVRKINEVFVKCRIVETEAYVGPHDKGAHCYNNKKTERTKYFWNIGGCLYVYMIHNHNCMNIVASTADRPEAVLIRAVEPLSGIDEIKKVRGDKNPSNDRKKLVNLSNGPGKVGGALNVDRSHNAVDLCTSEEIFLIEEPDFEFEMERSVRININYAEEYIYKPWRFYIKGNPFVSKVKPEHEYKDD